MNCGIICKLENVTNFQTNADVSYEELHISAAMYWNCFYPHPLVMVFTLQPPPLLVYTNCASDTQKQMRGKCLFYWAKQPSSNGWGHWRRKLQQHRQPLHKGTQPQRLCCKANCGAVLFLGLLSNFAFFCPDMNVYSVAQEGTNAWRRMLTEFRHKVEKNR